MSKANISVSKLQTLNRAKVFTESSAFDRPWDILRGGQLNPKTYFCVIEVRAMVVAVQQPLAECTTIFTMCIVEHRPLPCTVTIYTKPAQINSGMDSKTYPRSQVNALATHQMI